MTEKEAVKIVSESEIGYYDLILMDIQMPKMVVTAQQKLSDC